MIAILIFTHRNLNQTKRLIESLRHKEVDIYVHIDKKCNEEYDFKDVVVLEKRNDIRWGVIKQTDAYINAFREIPKKYTHYMLISGQDYLIEPIEKIVDFFSKNKNKILLEYTKIGKDYWNIENRYTEYNINNKYLNALLRRILPKRKFIKDMIPYGGSSWFTFSNDSLKYLIDFYDKNNLKKKFRYTLCMDEVLFASILMNSKYKNNIINDNKVYVDWSDHKKGLNKGNPNLLKKEDYEKIIKSGKFIARKFDDQVDNEILDMLDEYRSKRK